MSTEFLGHIQAAWPSGLCSVALMRLLPAAATAAAAAAVTPHAMSVSSAQLSVAAQSWEEAPEMDRVLVP